MSVPPPPPPPAPPPASIKGPIPVTNKALLSSIQKGAKLKKVPETAKNDRSEAQISNKPASNGPQMRTANESQSFSQDRFSKQQPSPMTAPNKQINNFQSELANQISMSLRKTSLPASTPPPIRQVPKSNVPLPNQFNSANNKPPPPPPVNKKPMLRSSTTELSKPMTDTHDNIDKPLVQPQVINKVHPPIPKQLSNRPTSAVSRVTSNPPPPLPNVFREAPKLPPTLVNPPSNILSNPPRVPVRVMNPPPSNQIRTSSVNENQHKLDRAPPAPPPSNQMRPSSVNENQYKLNRAPPAAPPSNQMRPPSVNENQYKLNRAPPPPPLNNSNHRTSNFDSRFKFPDERNFPSPQNLMKQDARSY